MADRYLSFDTPLSLSPPDLLLASFEGEEALSRPFNFIIGFWSTKLDIAGKDLIGQSVTVTINTSDSSQRYFNGIVSNLQAGELDGGHTNRFYRAEIVPKLQLLAETSNCRIFQNMATPDIVEQVLNEQGITDFSDNLTGTYNPREYCVQYRETDLNFISRLLEEEGIFYYFQHTDGKHTLVLADATSAYQDCPDNQLVYSSSASMTTATIRSWDHAFRVLTGEWTLTDYNFETPSASLLASTSTTSKWSAQSSERFDYPGLYQRKADGTTVSKLRMEADEALSETVRAQTLMPSLFPGGKFTISDHELDAEKGDGWAIVSVRHKASDDTQINAGGGGRDYSNEILVIPQATCFRPRRVTPKPYIHGLQTAVVTGASGEEIYPDKYGRVTVKFFWDRSDADDDKSSCAIRVATTMAGKNWGMVHLPRVGQEVVVSFLEGDPDRPLIIGLVYNADYMPPYTLPDNKTQSGYKSRSSKSGGTDDFNELRFEDLKGSEDIYFHAQKDFHRVVENTDTLTVGSSDSNTCPDGSQTISIWKDRTTSIETGNESLTVKQGNRTTSIDTGNDSLTVKQGNRTTSIDTGNDSLTVKQGTRTVTVSGDTSLEVQQGNRTVTIDTGNDTHKISQGNRQVTISTGNDTLEISMGNLSTKVDMGSVSTEAMQSITLKVGQNSVTIDQTGVTIQGLMVKINGQTQTQIQGLQTQVSGSGMVQISGGITMIG